MMSQVTFLGCSLRDHDALIVTVSEISQTDTILVENLSTRTIDAMKTSLEDMMLHFLMRACVCV